MGADIAPVDEVAPALGAGIAKPDSLIGCRVECSGGTGGKNAAIATGEFRE